MIKSNGLRIEACEINLVNDEMSTLGLENLEGNSSQNETDSLEIPPFSEVIDAAFKLLAEDALRNSIGGTSLQPLENNDPDHIPSWLDLI